MREGSTHIVACLTPLTRGQDIGKSLDDTNVSLLLQLSDMHNLGGLKRKCIHYIETHQDTVRQTPEFAELPAVLRRQVACLNSHDDFLFVAC
jgi:hypothetical protein